MKKEGWLRLARGMGGLDPQFLVLRLRLWISTTLSIWPPSVRFTVLRLTPLVLANRAVVVQDLIPPKCPPEEIRICVTAFTAKGLGFALVGVA